MTRRLNGFSLLELMIAVVVVAILAAIAVPMYQNHVFKSRRTDAQGALSGLANAMERFYTANTTYLGAAGTQATPANSGAPWIFAAQSPVDGANKYYNLTIKNNVTAVSYTLVATPIGAQASDGVLELDSTGARRWDRNNNGAFGADENCWSITCN